MSAQGIDISAYQPPLKSVAGLDFVFVKATEGTDWIDPNFAANWAYLATKPVHRGAYHFFHPSLPADQQASFFMRTVTERGLHPGDMLAGDCEITEGLATGPPAAGFLGRVAAAAEGAAGGPHCPVMCYSYLSFLPNLGSYCTGFPLWIADYSSSAPRSVAPWPSWTFWQWSGGGGPDGADQDAFNGTAASLDTWLSNYAGPEPAPPENWTEHLVQQLPLLQQGASGPDVRTMQACLVARGQQVTIDGTFGPATKRSLQRFQQSAGIAGDGIAGPRTWPKLLNR